MLPTLIQWHNKNSFYFWSSPFPKRGSYRNFTGCQMPHFMILLILYINLLNLSRIKQMSIFEEYGAFNAQIIAITPDRACFPTHTVRKEEAIYSHKLNSTSSGMRALDHMIQSRKHQPLCYLDTSGTTDFLLNLMKPKGDKDKIWTRYFSKLIPRSYKIKLVALILKWSSLLPYKLKVLGWISLCKQCRHRSDATECGIWSGSTLLAAHPTVCMNTHTQLIKWTCLNLRTSTIRILILKCLSQLQQTTVCRRRLSNFFFIFERK